MHEVILQVQHLSISFDCRTAVRQLCWSVAKGKTLAIVGESGSGKSVTALAVLGLLPSNASIQGEILFKQENLLELPLKKMRAIRGGEIAMIFQEPTTSLNPVFSVGEQIEETVKIHHRVSRRGVRAKVLAALVEVGIPIDRAGAYPHEFSGGMQQRVMIAMALACEPVLLIADEPTTALDATTSRQIVDLLYQAKQRRGMSMLFITHDLSLVASVADDICVMKNGTVMETGSAKQVLQNPVNDYTKALLACRPSITHRLQRLQTISDYLA